MPEGVTQIGSGAFAYCNKMSFQLAPDHPVFELIDGVLFRKSDKTLICYPASLAQGSYAVPEGTLAIGDGAFYVNESLAQISLPGSVTTIGDKAFYYCRVLTQVDLPDSLISIGEEAFYSCISLVQVVLPDSLTSIGESAFYNCRLLEQMTLPAGVAQIGSGAFVYCDALTLQLAPGNPVFELIDGGLFHKDKTKRSSTIRPTHAGKLCCA